MLQPWEEEEAERRAWGERDRLEDQSLPQCGIIQK